MDERCLKKVIKFLVFLASIAISVVKVLSEMILSHPGHYAYRTASSQKATCLAMDSFFLELLTWSEPVGKQFKT